MGRSADACSASDVSVVVQGPVAGAPGDAARARLTLRCLESVRRHLPGAELVLSTWRGADVTGLPFDRLVESEDPGGMRCDSWPSTRAAAPATYNTNRQIVSTREGLRAASRPYAVKIRSDMELTGDAFLDYFGRYPARSPEWRVLGERVTVPNWWSRDPRAPGGQAFHPSDWFQFGRREDVRALWEVPLTDAEQALWYATRPRPAAYADTHLHFRYTVEQYTWLAFLRQHGPVPFAHQYDLAPDVVRLSELTLANNLVVADLAALGLRFLKYAPSPVYWGTLYTHGAWRRLYRDYCDPAFEPGVDVRTLERDVFNRAVGPARRFLASPRSTPLGRRVSLAWEARHPTSFRLVKASYVGGWAEFRRVLGRRG